MMTSDPTSFWRPRLSWRRKLFFIGIILLVLGGGVEIAARLFDWVRGQNHVMHDVGYYVYQPDQYIGYRHKPNVVIHGKEEVAATFDSHGFRGRAMPPERSETTVRIFCIGGSATEGEYWKQTQEQSWPWRLHDNLRAACPELDVQVMNAGVAGYSIFESRRDLESRILPLLPDIVVVYHTWNDLKYARAFASGTLSQYPLRLFAEPDILDQALHLSTAALILRNRLSRGKTVTETFFDRELPKLTDPIPDAAWMPFDRELGRIAELAKQHGFMLVFVQELSAMRSDLPKAMQGIVNLGYLGVSFEQGVALHALFDARVRYWGEQSGNLHVRTDDLGPMPEMMLDHVHLTALGNDTLATRIAQVMTTAGTLHTAHVRRLGQQ